MKKLSKINFKDAAILSDIQMKTVFGGSGYYFDNSKFACKDKTNGTDSVFVKDGKIYYGTCCSVSGGVSHCSDFIF